MKEAKTSFQQFTLLKIGFSEILLLSRAELRLTKNRLVVIFSLRAELRLTKNRLVVILVLSRADFL